MRRSICKGVLEALAYCHKRSVAHGSLGPGSILLNTFRDQQARELIVKLDNFGFAQLRRTGVPSRRLWQPCMLSDWCFMHTSILHSHNNPHHYHHCAFWTSSKVLLDSPVEWRTKPGGASPEH